MKPTRYKIKSASDFLDVPEDKLDLCLEEFKEFLVTAREIMECMPDIKEVSEELILQIHFIWIDDGKRGGKIAVTIKEKESTA